MGRAPCCDKSKVKRGPWSPEEDTILKNFVDKHGTAGSWIALPHKAGLKRCGKSCRLRWLNYLRPNIKHGGFTEEEDTIILALFRSIGSRWSVIASQLPGRTDNDVKNYWNTKLKKKLMAPANLITSSTQDNDINMGAAGCTNSKFDINSSHQHQLLLLPNAYQYAAGVLIPPAYSQQPAAVSTPSFCVEGDAAFLGSDHELMPPPYQLLNVFDHFDDDIHVDNFNFGYLDPPNIYNSHPIQTIYQGLTN